MIFWHPTTVIYNRDPRFNSDFWQSLWKLLKSHAIVTFAHHPQADGQTECINCTIGQILHAHLLDKNQKHWPDYVAFTEMAINSTINASINKASFKIFHDENIPLPISLLLSRESSFNSYAQTFANNIKQLVSKVKCTIHYA